MVFDSVSNVSQPTPTRGNGEFQFLWLQLPQREPKAHRSHRSIALCKVSGDREARRAPIVDFQGVTMQNHSPVKSGMLSPEVKEFVAKCNL